MTEMTNTTVLESPISESIFEYNSEMDFTHEVKVSDSKLKFVPNLSQVHFDEPSEANDTMLVEKFKEVEDTLNLINVSSLRNFKPVAILPEGYLFSITDSEGVESFGLIAVKTDMSTNQVVSQNSIENAKKSLALRLFYKLLKVPFDFAIKNPSTIQAQITDYWTKALPNENSNPLPLSVITRSQTHTVRYEDNDIEVRDIMSLYRAKALKTGKGYVADFQPMERLVPCFSKAIPAVKEVFSASVPDATAFVKNANFGFDNETHGQHFVRFIVPAKEVVLDNNKYEVMINLRSDFSNQIDSFKTTMDIGIFRLVCSNGLTAKLPVHNINQIKEAFVQHGLEQARIGKDKDGNEIVNELDSAAEAKVRENLTKKFDSMFDPKTSSFKFGNEVFQNGQFPEEVKTLIALFSDFESIVKDTLAPLNANVPVVSNEEFIKALEHSSRKFGIDDKIKKAIGYEYLSERMDANSTPLKIRNGMDIANMVTFLSRSASDTNAQIKMEQNSVDFVNDLFDSLNGVQQDNANILDKYLRLAEPVVESPTIN